jgi:hypothetical protein
MTQRDRINQLIRRDWAYIWAALILFTLGFVAIEFIDQHIAIWLPVAAFLLIPVYFYKILNISCSRCSNKFGAALNTGKRIYLFRKISEDFKYCPFCGESMDAD